MTSTDKSAAVRIDFKQATELLAMFGGEPCEITLQVTTGHSGNGLYAYYTDLPEEGCTYLGVTDEEAVPDATPADPGAVANCPNIAEPRNCYRVRCQLGKKCVEPKQITSVQREAIVRRAIAERDAALAAPSVPSAPAAEVAQVAVVTDAMVDAYLKANDAYWKRTDELPNGGIKWRCGTPKEATRESLIAALASSPSSAPAESGWLPVAVAKRGGTQQFGYATIITKLRGANTLPLGETILYAAPQAVQAGGEGGNG